MFRLSQMRTALRLTLPHKHSIALVAAENFQLMELSGRRSNGKCSAYTTKLALKSPRHNRALRLTKDARRLQSTEASQRCAKIESGRLRYATSNEHIPTEPTLQTAPEMHKTPIKSTTNKCQENKSIATQYRIDSSRKHSAYGACFQKNKNSIHSQSTTTIKQEKYHQYCKTQVLEQKMSFKFIHKAN